MKSTFKTPTTLMIQGTSSDAGKTTLVAALCRILSRRGIKVAPFKSQNMSLNSAVTPDGKEISRAQAVQAFACNIAPSSEMNPILIKPHHETEAQVILNGKPIGTQLAKDYNVNRDSLLNEVIKAHDKLKQSHDMIIAEGAGSPAEINLRDRDIVNMGLAEAIDCPVIIIADIDRGGVFAHLVGTYELLSTSEQERIIGFIINRFRGDKTLLEPGIEWLEKRTNIPVLAVIPYIENLHIEAEDAPVLSQNLDEKAARLNVTVPFYPTASNHTDLDPLRLHPQVNCLLQRSPDQFFGTDLIILPGSKCVRQDLTWLRESGWERLIKKHLRYGGKLIGLCGGYQMLGNWIHDPKGLEGQPGSTKGLELIDMETSIEEKKTLANVTGVTVYPFASTPCRVTGYEIHMGITTGPALSRPLFKLSNGQFEGAAASDGAVIGSYLHGLFEDSNLLKDLLTWAGLSITSSFNYTHYRQAEMNRLADIVENSFSKEVELIKYFS